MAYQQPRICTDCREIIPDHLPYYKKLVEWRQVGKARAYVRGVNAAYQCEPCAREDKDWNANALADIMDMKETVKAREKLNKLQAETARAKLAANAG